MATREITREIPREIPRAIPCAASSLVDGLFDRSESPLLEVTRTTVSVHYETGDPAVPVLCVCTRTAIRLPNSVVTDELPRPGAAARVGGGVLHSDGTSWVPRRWWAPPRPRGLRPPHLVGDFRFVDAPRFDQVALPDSSYDGLDPIRLVGAGPGLTPAGDDVLAGALVTAHATRDARTQLWQQQTRRALAARSTTAVSRAMLHHAMDGYATSELADFLIALCSNQDTDAPLRRLLAVGHTSGTALLSGVLHTLNTHQMRGAA